MSVRHYLHVFPTFCAAGPQVRATALMRGFGPDCRHTVVSLDGRTEAAELAGSAQIRLIADKPGTAPGAGLHYMRQLILREKPDLLLSYNWGAIDAPLAARSLGWRRLVHHEDGFNADEAQRLKTRRNLMRRLLLKKTDVIVPSRKLATIARQTWKLERVHFIANGINAAAFKRDSALGSTFRESLGITPDDVIVGSVAHLRPVKNLSRLIRAVAATGHARVHLVVVGDGEEHDRLKALAKELGVAMHCTGHLRDLQPVYSAFDIFAMSSDSEQQPVSLLEAMASGLPVCATDVGDIAITLPEMARVALVPLGPSADERLAVALSDLIENSELRAIWGEANRQHVSANFSEEAMLDAYAKTYADAQTR